MKKALACLLLMGMPAPAVAQDFFLPNTSAIIQGAVMGEVLRDAYGGAEAPSAPSDRAAPMGLSPLFQGGGQSARQAPVALPVRPTPAVRQAALAAYAGRLKANNPAMVEPFQAYFRQHDYSALFRTAIAGTGLRETDLGDVMAAFTMLGWLIVNDVRDDMPPETYRGLRDQLAPALAANPKLTDPATRASLAEEQKISLVVLLAGWQGAVREGNLAAYRRGVAQMFRTQGLELAKLQVTDAGFSAR